MKKNFLSLLVLTLVSFLIFALPTMADTKPVSPNTHSEADMKDMSDQEMSGHSEGEAALEVIVANGKFQVSVQADPEKPAPKKPVNIMIIVKEESTGQPVLDASVNVEMMLMDVGTHGSMAGMDNSSETTLHGHRGEASI